MSRFFEPRNRDTAHGARAAKKNLGHGLRSTEKIVRGTCSGERGPSLAMENLQARLRGMQLMYLSNAEGRLVLTTGNKSELAMGYCTLYGDMAGGLAVIGDVYKTDVYRLARWRNSVPNPVHFLEEMEMKAGQTALREKKQKVWTFSPVIPDAVLDKAPSAELRPNQKDQDSLPPYDVLDGILECSIEKGLSAVAIARKLKEAGRFSAGNAACPPGGRMTASGKRGGAAGKGGILSLVRDVVRKVDHNEYKRRQAPPILRVTEKAWFGRRMPITNRFQG